MPISGDLCIGDGTHQLEDKVEVRKKERKKEREQASERDEYRNK